MYNYKKGLSNAAFIFLGVILLHLAPYMNQLSAGVVPDDLMVLVFWRKLLVSGCVITFVAELKYLYKWLATMNGNGNGGGTVIQTPTSLTQGTTDAKTKNPLQLS